jgi:hypothetical protein
MPKKKLIKFVDVSKDLCESCSRAYIGGCPVWPTLELTKHCVEYNNTGSCAPQDTISLLFR